jgi:hypothetical protein
MLKLPPPAAPLPRKPRSAQVDRFRGLICSILNTIYNPQDRKKFGNLLDYLQQTSPELPTHRADGRSDHVSRKAVVYAACLRALDLLRAEASSSEEIDKQLDFIEWAKTSSSLASATSVLEGNAATGYTLVRR